MYLIIGIPKDMLGTKTPSITSKWYQSASLLFIISHSLCRLAKSEANKDGAIRWLMN
jgi:hypothetical protein